MLLRSLIGWLAPYLLLPCHRSSRMEDSEYLISDLSIFEGRGRNVKVNALPVCVLMCK